MLTKTIVVIHNNGLLLHDILLSVIPSKCLFACVCVCVRARTRVCVSTTE